MQRSLAGCLTVAALLAAMSSGAHAQAPARTAYNTVFLELGGNAGIYSVNYERVLPSAVSLRAGFSYLSVSAASGTSGSNVTWSSFPLTVSYLGLGGGTVKFEVGGGVALHRFSGSATWGFGDEVKTGAFVPLPTAIAGLRIAPAGGGFNFKLAYTPLYVSDASTKLFNWGGMAFGIGF